MSTGITPLGLVFAYGLLLLPLGIMLWHGVPMIGRTLLAVLRMTVQLILVGLYLQVVFDLDSVWLTLLWLAVMIGVADVSIARSAGLRLGRMAAPLAIALLAGTSIPLAVFEGFVLEQAGPLEARFVIPIAGMILGNCLRADIIGIRAFYHAIRDQRAVYELALAQGATVREAAQPFMRSAIEAALAPTVATIATIGLVSLPGMMTGVMLGGQDPMTAIQYQIAIMLAILAGAAVTVWLAITLTLRRSFTPYGQLDETIFTR